MGPVPRLTRTHDSNNLNGAHDILITANSIEHVAKHVSHRKGKFEGVYHVFRRISLSRAHFVVFRRSYVQAFSVDEWDRGGGASGLPAEWTRLDILISPILGKSAKLTVASTQTRHRLHAIVKKYLPKADKCVVAPIWEVLHLVVRENTVPSKG